MKNKTLVIVAGAAGEIGTEFCKAIVEQGFICIGVVRHKKTNIVADNFFHVECHLDDEKQIENVFLNIDFQDYEKIIYLHTIGSDRFDPRGYPNIKPMETIDSDIYKTNVNSFKYLLRYCVNRIKDINKNIEFRVAIIAGVPDKYTPFVIEPFCEAKFILRQYIQSYVNLYPSWVSGLSINITSTVTKSALSSRPHADITYWLTPKEVVDQSIKKLISDLMFYEEINIIKNSPEFSGDYYENKELLYKKWSKETGIY